MQSGGFMAVGFVLPYDFAEDEICARYGQAVLTWLNISRARFHYPDHADTRTPIIMPRIAFYVMACKTQPHDLRATKNNDTADSLTANEPQMIN